MPVTKPVTMQDKTPDEAPRGALDGMRVLDFSRFVAGPYCAMLLGDMGAEVVKIERPGAGEVARGVEPGVDGQSYYCFVVNRNKKGLSIDFRSDQGRAILRDLVARADVLVENFRPGVMEAMGLDWPTVQAINPRLVMVRISGFGQDGPLAGRQCFDAVAQAMSGIMAITGQPGGPPTLAGTTIIDYTTGMYGAMGALAALNARHTTGRGQLVDVSLLDSATSLLLSAIPDQVMGGVRIPLRGNRDRFSAPTNTFPTADDRWVLINCAEDAMFGRMTAAMGQPALAQDPRFADVQARLAHVEALEALIADWTRTLDADEVVAAMDRANVPSAKVATMDEVIANQQLRHRGQITEIAHQSGARVTAQGVTMHLSDTPLTIRRALPYVGEHSDEILTAWLGYSPQSVNDLKIRGII